VRLPAQPTGRVNGAPPPPRSLDDVRGWLKPADAFLMAWLLDRQTRLGQRGDVVELGVYHGKSAIVIGYHLVEGERFVVCDLFDQVSTETTERADIHSYKGLTQAIFESNYLAFHGMLPVIVQGLSSEIVNHVPSDSCRFVHVDASHFYEHVRIDIGSARSILREDGIVVFDDYRSAHTPGTAAAVWEAMVNDGLQVVCVTDNKFYGTWGDASPVRQELVAELTTGQEYQVGVQSVMGQQLVRVTPKLGKGAAVRPRWRRVAAALLPPVVAGTIRRHRRVH
jgi:hypothetical protein